MKKGLTIFLTVCILVSLFFFLQATDLKVVISLIQKTGYKFFLLLLITFIAYFFGTISWQFSLGEYSRSVSTGRLFLIRHVGETAGMLNPASVIGGDALKAIMLSKYNIPERKIVWSMLFSRGIMIISQVLLLGLTALILLLPNPSSPDKLFNGKQSGLYPLLLVSWKAIRVKFAGVLEELPVMLRENRRMLMYACFFALLHWVFGGLEFYFILKFLGVKVSILHALLVDLGVVLFRAAGAFIPGQLGIEEYGNKIMLLAIGLPAEEIWVTASILRRARQLFWIAFGVAVYFLLFKRRETSAMN
ncbi:lysylphosphatidylglycerol synthase domain-containing protein [Pedobacter psychroterrae]|uniref:Lysylphosphatidylglycerol synthase-like protein n=1 Tax=Pedobacter psychroterrae TaxID=2530453 RepID=A0A4R0NRN2_9SPHI|nr:lysylphosphatidylglycerol synthase domain-containing protein [Pedobacter psychroterrae]TCD03792.1 hypothetical protein EZ437_07515 [Pedobacter psychroterrae]